MRPIRTFAVGLGAAIAMGGAAAVSVSGGGALHASASIVDTAGVEVGWARLVEDATGVVHVNVHARGLTPGLHGIHLHNTGACATGTTPAFSSAGGHHNPLARTHGLLSATGPHAGDLPNLVVNEDGIGRLAVTTDRSTLERGAVTLFDANGSAIVIHAAQDDQVTDATGNSGARVACGVLVEG